jgi:hypothetical protein
VLRAMRDNRVLDLGQSANTPQNVGCASLILYAKAISVPPGGTLQRSIELPSRRCVLRYPCAIVRRSRTTIPASAHGYRGVAHMKSLALVATMVVTMFASVTSASASCPVGHSEALEAATVQATAVAHPGHMWSHPGYTTISVTTTGAEKCITLEESVALLPHELAEGLGAKTLKRRCHDKRTLKSAGIHFMGSRSPRRSRRC